MTAAAGRIAASLLLGAGALTSHAQGIPTAQPSFLSITREEVKVGHGEDHARLEAGWPAAYARAKSTNYYLAFVSMTGPSESWYISPSASHAAMGEAQARDDADPVLSAELARLSRADAVHLNGLRTVQVAGRTDLSYGAYPDLGLVRFAEVTTFRVRPGFEPGFEAAAKAYATAARKAVPGANWRVYEVMAGMPGPTFLVFNTFTNRAGMDQGMKDGQAMAGAMTAEDGAMLQKFGREGLISTETQYFRIDPGQSYVDAATKAKDPAFWNPKRPAARPAGQP